MAFMVRVERNVRHFQEKRKNGMNVKFSAKCVAVIAAGAMSMSLAACSGGSMDGSSSSNGSAANSDTITPHTARPKSPASSWLWTRSTPRAASTARRSSSSPWTIRATPPKPPTPSTSSPVTPACSACSVRPSPPPPQQWLRWPTRPSCRPSLRPPPPTPSRLVATCSAPASRIPIRVRSRPSSQPRP